MNDPHLLLGRIIDAATDLAHLSTKFRAVGYVDNNGVVHWEPGRMPQGERMLYVTLSEPSPQPRSPSEEK